MDTSFTCVGTSATVTTGSSDNPRAKEEGRERLCEFATTLFGSEFDNDSVIEETRVSTEDFLSIDESLKVPSDTNEVECHLLEKVERTTSHTLIDCVKNGHVLLILLKEVSGLFLIRLQRSF